METLSHYLPPRFVQALVLLATFVVLFGSERVARWIEALGVTLALRLLGIEHVAG